MILTTTTCFGPGHHQDVHSEVDSQYNV